MPNGAGCAGDGGTEGFETCNNLLFQKLFEEEGEEEALMSKLSRHQQETLEHVGRLRVTHEARLAAAAAAAEERRVAELAAKQAEWDEMESKLSKERSQHRTTQAARDRMLEAYDSIQHIRQQHILRRRALCAWLSHHQARRAKRQAEAKADSHRRLLRLQGKPLIFWLHWMRVERHAKTQQAMQVSMERHQEAVWADAHAHIDAMRAQVARAEAIAQQEVRLRVELEGRLKSVFMRGVAALNTEAQEIISQASPPQQQQGGREGELSSKGTPAWTGQHRLWPAAQSAPAAPSRTRSARQQEQPADSAHEPRQRLRFDAPHLESAGVTARGHAMTSSIHDDAAQHRHAAVPCVVQRLQPPCESEPVGRPLLQLLQPVAANGRMVAWQLPRQHAVAMAAC